MNASTINYKELAETFAKASPEDKAQFADVVSHEAAIQAVFAHPPLSADGSNIYVISETWHAAEVAKDDDFTIATSLDELKALLQDRESDMIVASAKLGITLDALETLAAKAPYSKTLLWDATTA